MSLVPSFSSRSELEQLSREQCKNAYLGGRVSLCRVLGQYNFYVPTEDLSVAPHLIMDGFWEAWITLAVLRNCSDRQGAVAINVGANIGYYSVLLGGCVGPSGRLVGFEPQDELAKLASRNLTINGMMWGSIINKAVGDGSISRVFLNPYSGYMGSAFVTEQENPGSTRVDLVSIDSVTEVCDILFIDAEGYEEEIIRGAQKALAAADDPIVFLEFSPAAYGNPSKFFEYLAMDYQIFKVDFDGGLKSVCYDEISKEGWSMLALKRGCRPG